MKIKPNAAYGRANEGQFSVADLVAPSEFLVEFTGFREGENKQTGVAFIASDVKILNVISGECDENISAIGKTLDIVTNFGPSCGITISTLVKAFRGYGFNCSKWNDKPESDTQYAIMVPASLKYLAVHRVKGVIKVVVSKQPGKEPRNFANLVKLVRQDLDGVDFPDNPPEVIEYDHIAEAWDAVLSKDTQDAVKAF